MIFTHILWTKKVIKICLGSSECAKGENPLIKAKKGTSEETSLAEFEAEVEDFYRKFGIYLIKTVWLSKNTLKFQIDVLYFFYCKNKVFLFKMN